MGPAGLVAWLVGTGLSLALLPRTGSPPPASEEGSGLLVAERWRWAGAARGVPVIDGDVVFSLTRGHEVIAIRLQDGALLWRQTTEFHETPTRGSTLIALGDLIVAGDEDVFAFDKATGAPRWRFTPADGYAPGVYLSGEAHGLVFTGSPVGRMYAIHAASGRLRWNRLIDEDRTTVFWPVTDGSTVCAGFSTFTAPTTGGVVAIDAATGRERWRTRFEPAASPWIGADWAGGPLIVGDLVIAASGEGRIHAFGLDDGAVRWTLPPVTEGEGADGPLPDFRPLAASGEWLFAGSMTGRLIAYDIASRQPRWEYAPARSGSMAFTMTSGDRSLYVPWASGFLTVVRHADGVEQWRSRTAGFLWPPAISGSLVVAASPTEGLVAFDLEPAVRRAPRDGGPRQP